MVAAEQPGYGEVYDRGYQHYDGPRLGRGHAIWALTTYSMKRALGIKKGIGAKIIPILLYIGVLVPVIVAIGVKGFLPQAEFIDYAGFFGISFLIEGIFVATIAPEMLSGDRRENVLPLYFSRAITRLDYLLAKLAATAILTLTVSFVPVVILWLGNQLLEAAPLEAMRDNLDDLGRIVIVGVLIAFYLGAIGLMVSSFTGRKSIAVGIIVFGFLMTEAFANTLLFAANLDLAWQRIVVFFSPTLTVTGLATRMWDVDADPITSTIGLPATLYGAVMVGVVLVCGVVMYLRYVPNE
ncbi:MAG: ABC transporter permease [Chloroflexota bacterium]|nr:ABC transporter permease [Chloroflexota bacterium]